METLEVVSSENFGGKTSYYQVFSDCSDVDDFCAKYNVGFFMGNIIKAAVRIFTKEYETKDGDIRDLNKIIHYAQREKDRRLGDKKEKFILKNSNEK
jgi:hypothetical protein